MDWIVKRMTRTLLVLLRSRARFIPKDRHYSQRLVSCRKKLTMESKEYKEKLKDTGIGSTFASQQDKCIADITDQDNSKETSESTLKKAAVAIGTEVSPCAIILPEEPSLDLREVEILPSNDTIFELHASKARPRTLMSKGREYHRELKKAVLAYDHDLWVK